jgi:5-methylcytosine-specific restriction endonuclease McrA
MHTCAYCGDYFSATQLTRDHIIPKAQKGQDIWTNVVAACKNCNQTKDNRTPEQANMQLLFVPYVPTKAEYLILKNRKILADQMEFLMKNVPDYSRLHKQ